jgi:hypothetical protein
MIDTDEREKLRQSIAASIAADRHLLDKLRAEIRPLVGETRRIQQRNTSSISLVAADGGNNQLQFDPFLIQMVRVVDSANNSHCLEVVTPNTSIDELSARQFGIEGEATRLGEMMEYLGVRHLSELSQMIHANPDGRAAGAGWIQVYRELIEWAVLFYIVRTKDFGNDTLIVFDGLLRSVVFAQDLFARLMEGMSESIDRHWQRNRSRVYLVGVAKRSKVLDRYRLAMALEGLLTVPYAAYVEVPRELEERAGHRSQYRIGLNAERDHEGGNLRVAGRLFWAKFGSATRDPIWPVDVYEPQVPSAQVILGSLLYDAVQGFPVPFYPRCLQQAHDHAALVGFDLDILQDEIFEGIRTSLGLQSSALDIFRLRDEDPAQARYS